MSTAEPVAIFAALGDPTRLQLVARLAGGEPLSISTLTDGMDLTRQAVTKHLHVLESAGIVSSRRVGRESRFSYEPGAVKDASACLNRVSEQWDDALARLQAFVET